MKFLIYEMYHQSPKENKDIYILKQDNFLAIIIDNLPKAKEERIKKIQELRNNYKLKLIEVTQEQFLKFINSKNIKIQKIEFQECLEDEDKEEIEKFLKEKKYIELLNKLKENNRYYYIMSVQIELIEENLIVNLKKNLEVEVSDNSLQGYSLEKIFDILEEKKIIKTLIK